MALITMEEDKRKEAEIFEKENEAKKKKRKKSKKE